MITVNNRPITYVEEISSLSPEALTRSHLYGCLINTYPTAEILVIQI